MTEFEINKAVADRLNLNTIAYDRVEIVLLDDMDATQFDPCNNAQQAWDIMLANDIGITQCLHDDDYCAYRGLWGEGESFNPEHLTCNSEFFFNSKPFVAAMLLFLGI